MSFSVNTNAGAFAALGNLNRTSQSLDVTQSRVNTGLKVSSAKDNAAVYSIAQKLRGDVAGFRAVNSSLDRATSELDVAIAGAEAISDLLIEMKEKAVAAKDTGLDTASRTSLNNDFVQLRSQIDSIANNATFNGKNLLTGGALSAITDATGSSTISASVTQLTTAGLGIDSSSIDGANTPNTLISDGTSVESGDALIAWNSWLEDNFNSFYNDPLQYDQSTSEFINTSPTPTIDAAFVSDFGIGITMNVVGSGSNRIGMNGDIYLQGSGSSATFTTSSTSNSASEAVDAVEAAIDTVNDALSTLGATANRVALQQQFTGKLSDSVNIGIGNLVDADLARESANLQAFQTKQQLGLQALSIANQAPQSVLSLFR